MFGSGAPQRAGELAIEWSYYGDGKEAGDEACVSGYVWRGCVCVYVGCVREVLLKIKKSKDPHLAGGEKGGTM